MYDLYRLFEILTGHGRPQHRMALQQILPGARKGRPVDLTAQGGNQLLNIDPRARRIQAMEEHALLQRRERVYILDRVQAHCTLVCSLSSDIRQVAMPQYARAAVLVPLSMQRHQGRRRERPAVQSQSAGSGWFPR